MTTVTEITRDAAYHEDPVARHLRDLVHPRTVQAIRRLAAERGITDARLNAFSVSRFNCYCAELTKDAAEHLRWLLEGGAIRPRPRDEEPGAYCSFGERPEIEP